MGGFFYVMFFLCHLLNTDEAFNIVQFHVIFLCFTLRSHGIIHVAFIF
jgi:hypothetical protein